MTKVPLPMPKEARNANDDGSAVARAATIRTSITLDDVRFKDFQSNPVNAGSNELSTLNKTMNLKTPLHCVTGFFASLSLGVGIVLGASEYDRNIEKTFQASSGGKLIVQADQGSIKVNSNGGDGDGVHVRVLRHARGGSQAQAD